MLPECLALYFRFCIWSPESSKNSGHGRTFETLNFTINKKDDYCWFAVMCISSRAGVYIQWEKHVFHVQLHWRAGM